MQDQPATGIETGTERTCTKSISHKFGPLNGQLQHAAMEPQRTMGKREDGIVTGQRVRWLVAIAGLEA